MCGFLRNDIKIIKFLLFFSWLFRVKPEVTLNSNLNRKFLPYWKTLTCNICPGIGMIKEGVTWFFIFFVMKVTRTADCSTNRSDPISCCSSNLFTHNHIISITGRCVTCSSGSVNSSLVNVFMSVLFFREQSSGS